jgi:hypothetical protein
MLCQWGQKDLRLKSSSTRNEGTEWRPRTIENQKSCTRESKTQKSIGAQSCLWPWAAKSHANNNGRHENESWHDQRRTDWAETRYTAKSGRERKLPMKMGKQIEQKKNTNMQPALLRVSRKTERKTGSAEVPPKTQAEVRLGWKIGHSSCKTKLSGWKRKWAAPIAPCIRPRQGWKTQNGRDLDPVTPK